jgi:hypothetical protein
MEDPIRLKILKAITATIAKVTPTNGYVLDLSKCSFRGRKFYGDDDPLPMVSTLEAPVQFDKLDPPLNSGPTRMSTMELLVQGFISVDQNEENPADTVYRFSAEVVRELFAASVVERGTPDILGLGIVVQHMRLGNPVVQMADEVSDVPYFVLPIEVMFKEDLTWRATP